MKHPIRSRTGWYILDEAGEPIPASMSEVASFLDHDMRRVALDKVDGATVSTVFLGLDHGFGSERPVLFETLVFDGPLDGDGERYCTRAEALAGHAEWVARVRAEADIPEMPCDPWRGRDA